MSTPEPGVIKQSGFGTSEVARRAETAATAAAATARAMIEAQYVMAMRNPRDWDEVRQRILRECDRTSFAREAVYLKPIGKGVSGLSIRFAEVAVRCMGNMAIPTTTTFDDEAKRIVCQSVVDLESNVHYSRDVTIEKTVERQQLRDGQMAISQRMNSYGKMVYLIGASEDDLLNKEGALVSKALRTLVLRLLPGDIQAEARARIGQTMHKDVASDPEGQKKAVLDAFYVLGVKPADVKEYLGHDLAAMSPEEVADLRGLHNAIKDGEATMKEAIANAKENRGEKAQGSEVPPNGGTATQKASAVASAVLDKVGAGRPRKCPECKTNNLKSAVEREFQKCDECRKKETDAIREGQGTAPQSGSAATAELEEEKATEAAEEEEPAEPAGNGRAIENLVARARDFFMKESFGNKAEAEIDLSSITNGKCAKFEKLGEYLTEHPLFVPTLLARIEGK